MLYLVTGWESHNREGDPAVLYCGMDAGQATAAVMAAPQNFKRVENATVHFSLQQTLPAVRPPAVPAPLGDVSEEEALAMLAEIERLHGALTDANAAGVAAVAEIERLKSLAAAAAKSPAAPAVSPQSAPVQETPAAETKPIVEAAESPAAAATKKAKR